MICKILKRVFYDYYSYNAIKYEAAKEMINQVEEIDQEAAYQLDEILAEMRGQDQSPLHAYTCTAKECQGTPAHMKWRVQS